ncbi:MAG: hypothetical protein RLZZ116_2401 [Planctomycetota bacterium]|jgi:hypothetical protein
MPRTTALTLACLGLTAPSALADAAAIDRALALVPEDAISFVAVPNLKTLSDDIAQLVEATGQGGLLSMGRPIDVLKAQLGVGANLDEKGAAVAYFPPVPAGAAPLGPALPIVVVPTTDGEAFLKANLTAKPDSVDGAFTTSTGQTVYARVLDGCVVLAPTKDSLPAALPSRGIAERFRGRLKPAELSWLDRADIVAWGSRDALRSAVEAARKAPAEIPDEVADRVPAAFAGMAGQQEAFRGKSLEIADMLADGLVVIDVDPLGIFLAALGVAEPSTPLAAVTAGGKGGVARFDRLPKNPFYLALAADLDGLGGAAKFGELMDLVGAPRTLVPEWVFSEGGDLRAMQLAAYPSKLGVAIGGALNDSAVFVASRAAVRTLARIRQSVESLSGEAEGIRTEASWNAEKKLKSGDVVTAFEVKETVVDASKRPPLDYVRLIKQFTFGSRGLNGFVKQRDDGVVVTFSQRPDVYSRALEGAAGTKSLAQDDTVTSIEEWLPAERDVELMIGVGQLANLVGQIAASFTSEEQAKSMLPPIPRDANPLAVAIEIGDGRARVVTVVPADVLKAAAAARGGNGPAPEAAP